MRQPTFSAAASAIMDAPNALPMRGPPATSERDTPDEGSGASVPPPDTRYLTEDDERIWQDIEDHERIAQGLNDVVVRRIFAAGLDLQAALLLIGNHRASSRIHDAVGQLDQAIMDIRDTVFGLATPARSEGRARTSPMGGSLSARLPPGGVRGVAVPMAGQGSPRPLRTGRVVP
jgi:hypothetical protein